MSTCACGLPVIPGYRCLDEAPRTFPVDVVILDINLPGRDGFELAGALVNRPEAGIIMLTGRTRSEDRLAGLSLGADHYLTKPLDPAELRLLVRNLARRVATAGRASAAPASCW